MIELAKNHNADHDLAYKSYADPDPVSKNMLIWIRNPATHSIIFGTVQCLRYSITAPIRTIFSI
jgi:hypothetical protein